jgi:site-specific recombinase XerC
MSTRLREALCCECGATRTVSARYSRRFDDPDGGQDLAELKCVACGVTTRHALVMGHVIEVAPPHATYSPSPAATSATPRYEVPDTMEEFMEDYARSMRSWGASVTTIRSRCKFAESSIDRFEGVPTAEKVREFLGRDGMNGWTRRTYYNHLRSWCAWLVEMEVIVSSPMDGIRAPSSPQSEPRPLSEDEVARVLEAAKGRTRDWIQIALVAGLRVHEIAKLRGEHVTEDGLRVLGKGGREAVLPVHPELWTIAQRYPRSGYWFPDRRGSHIRPETITGMVTSLFRSQGISGSVHRCRHTYGTRSYALGTTCASSRSSCGMGASRPLLATQRSTRRS